MTTTAFPSGPLPMGELLAQNLESLRSYVKQNLGAQVRARESASDIVQSVCREVLEERHAGFEYRGDAAFRRYLERCALHKIYRKWEYYGAQKRAVGREQRASSLLVQSGSRAGGISQIARTSRTASRMLMERQAVERMHAAIEKLPEKYRLAITLTKVMGMTSAEIAQRTGQTDGAVRNQVYRGLAQLGGILARDESRG